MIEVAKMMEDEGQMREGCGTDDGKTWEDANMMQYDGQMKERCGTDEGNMKGANVMEDAGQMSEEANVMADEGHHR